LRGSREGERERERERERLLLPGCACRISPCLANKEQKQNQERSTNCLHFKENTLHIACLLVVLDTGCGHRMWLLFSKAPPCPYVWACHCDTQRLVSHSLLLLRAYGSSGSGSTLAGALVPPHSSDAGSWATAKYKPPGLMTYTMTPRELLLRVVEASAS
jgi:hypothetical protein